MDKAIEKEVEVKRAAEVQARHDMMMDVDTEYNDRFQAVLTDMLQGRHISQTETEDRDMYRQIPTDHSYEEVDESDDDDDAKPTDF